MILRMQFLTEKTFLINMRIKKAMQKISTLIAWLFYYCCDIRFKV